LLAELKDVTARRITCLRSARTRAKKARWRNAAEVRRSYATASIVSAGRVVFNVKGNAYRMVVAVDFEKGIVWIKWIGAHKDYDRIDVTKVKHDG
jgi:mRNA interferase HigB